MAHYATKRFNYIAQVGFLTVFLGGGLLIGGFLSLLPLIGKIDISQLMHGKAANVMDQLLVPENAERLRWMQFISTLFVFFLPPVIYAWVCHKKPFTNLGFKHNIDARQILLVIAIMFACMPLVGALQELTEMLPFSKATLLKFKIAEEAYNKQVAAIARMNNFADYIVSVVVIAFLPAVFEETFFRGAMQNIFSRWFKLPVIAIIITSIIFSAIHGSYLGFLSRFALSFILGWMYYRTGNIWLNIIGHFTNNAVGVTALYFSAKAGEKADLSKIDQHFPLWIGLVSIAAVVGLFILFEKFSQKDINHPGEEVLIPGYTNPINPFEETMNDDNNQSSL
ncbi:MAG: CPBP family intramembrane metalloprotease [Sphingobacteriales bacterium]|nr:CPBP family intramembrane metalloprotease [Sphingobacteriales bacterium]